MCQPGLSAWVGSGRIGSRYRADPMNRPRRPTLGGATHGLFGATGLGSLSSAHHARSLPFPPASLPLLAYTHSLGLVRLWVAPRLMSGLAHHRFPRGKGVPWLEYERLECCGSSNLPDLEGLDGSCLWL